MPHKFNADRRDKIPKQKHRVSNWAEYDESLRRRGDLTVWISENALALWSAPPRMTPGGQPVYSDLAIELCLTFGMIFKQPLRQAEGLMRSIAGLLGVEIAVPHFTTLSRRGNGLSLPGPCCMEQEDVGTRPTRDGFQTVRSKLGRPSSFFRLRIRTPILASVFWFSNERALSLDPITVFQRPIWVSPRLR